MRTLGGKRLLAATAAAIAAVGLAACSSSGGGDNKTTGAGGPTGSSSGTSGSASPSGPKVKVKLQLQWAVQSQFAGYIAAKAKGFYDAQGLDVDIVPAGVDTVPQATVADGSADYAIAWVPKALQTREQGAGKANIVDVGQVFQRSATLQVSLKSSNITSVADFKGKNIGNWGFGNEYELFAGMTKAGLDPAKDVHIVQQDFNETALLAGDIDAAQAMIYNEYAQILETKNPKTGELYKPEDLNVVNWNDEGVAMLQDAVWANEDKLKDPAFQDTTVKFLTASYQGWIYCATNPEECASIVVSAGSKLGASHQLWQMNEVNKLIWPSPDGIGMVDDAAWKQTVTVAMGTKNADGKTVLTKQPDPGAYTNDYTEKALSKLGEMGLDTKGADFKPITVELKEGGA